MNLKASFLYQARDSALPMIWFYGIFIALVILFGSNTNGLEFASSLFLFIVGLNSFKSNLGMFVQNGVSRRCIFLGRLLTSVAASIFMATVDSALVAVTKALPSGIDGFATLFEHIYRLEGAALLAQRFAYCAAMYLLACTAGYFTTIFFYRLNKTWKWIVGVSIPLLLNFSARLIVAAAPRFFDSILGISANRPMTAALTFLVAAVLFGTLSFLLMRKAPVKW